MSLYQTLSSQSITKYRLMADPSIDLEWGNTLNHTLWSDLTKISSNRELLNAEKFQRFIPESPDWLNNEKIKLGQQFFKNNCREIMGLLGFASLPYCYAHINGAKVLIQSGRLSSDANRRLLETATFVFDCCRPHAFADQGVGFVSALKVRMIHSLIRNRLGKGWNEKESGKPVNQMDMAGTNMAFSLIAIRGMRRLGITVSNEEAEAYLHLWNYISYLLGLSDDLIPSNMKEAHWVSKTIYTKEAGYSDEGVVLTRSMIESMQGQPELSSLKGLIEPLISFCLGKECAENLGIQTSSSIEIGNSIKLLNWFSKSIIKETSLSAIEAFDKEIAKMDDKPVLNLPGA